jgi:hypothetical protein
MTHVTTLLKRVGYIQYFAQVLSRKKKTNLTVAHMVFLPAGTRNIKQSCTYEYYLYLAVEFNYRFHFFRQIF